MRTRKRPIVWMLLILLVSVSSAACSTIAGHRSPAAESLPAPASPSPEEARREKRILEEFEHWRASPHRLGGDTRGGVDCSGFVQALYRRVFEIQLPRTTLQQLRRGYPVSGNNLKAGDLVFFQPPDYPRHVGIYLSRNRFVHASKSRGVTVSQIGIDYWAKYYWTARRILPE